MDVYKNLSKIEDPFKGNIKDGKLYVKRRTVGEGYIPERGIGSYIDMVG